MTTWNDKIQGSVEDEFLILSLRFQPTHTSLIPRQLQHIFNAKLHEIVS